MQIYPHGDKLVNRIRDFPDEKELLEEIFKHYNIFKEACLQSDMTNIDNYLMQIVDHIDEYSHFFSNKKFDKIRKNSQSKIYPSILEEFMNYLFRPIVHEPLVCGSRKIPITSHLKLYNKAVASKSYEETLTSQTKNADFVIGILKESNIKGKKTVLCPLVVIENKRYADKTMRAAIENTARKVKAFSPDCLYVLVVDILSPFYSKKDYVPEEGPIDQTYGLREGNKPGDNNLRRELVLKLFTTVETHIQNIQTFISIEERYKRGYMRGP